MSVGCFVKVGVRGERFWCKVLNTSEDGKLHAVVDNDLLNSAWPRGHKLVIQHEHVLEVADVADQLSFEGLVSKVGSKREAALTWHAMRVSAGAAARPGAARFVVPK